MEIKPYPKNAKKHPDSQLKIIATSLREYGWRQPIVVDKDDTIIVGHGRWMAYKKYPDGIKEPWIVKADDLTPEQVRGYRLMDNKSNETGWDMGLALEELKELKALGYDTDLTGFDKDLLIEPDEKDDVIPENPPSIAKLGDVWALGEHRVMCGDSTKKEDVEKLMDGKKCAVTFTSPPYNAGKSEALSGNTHTTDNKYGEYNDNQTQGDWKQLVLDTLNLAMQVSEYQIYNIQMLAGNKKALLNTLSEYADHISDIAVWNKGHGAPAMAKNVMNSAYEWIIFFSSHPNATRAINTGSFRGKMKNIFDIPPQRQNDFSSVHAATMPVALPLEILKYVTKNGDGVYDNFIGTGTTLIAAEKTGRICYGMEIDPKYVDVTIKRWEDYTGQKAQKLS